MNVDALLQSIPPLAVYLVVAGVIGLESLGVPLPGEIILVAAALMSSRHTLAVDPAVVGLSAAAGAIIGDSIGYSIGRRFGMSLFERLGRRFPKHFGPGHVALARRIFSRWGVWAVFLGRFVALLRIFAGPLAGALKMRYGHFLAANAAGGLVWACGTTAVVYYLGLAAEKWLARFSWVALLVGAVVALTFTLLLKERTAKAIEELESEHDWDTLRQS
ncbi:MAG: DedA family protein [Mycobacterium sp.]|nr:DedA family protein [Mycobacterium sp.]